MDLKIGGRTGFWVLKKLSKNPDDKAHVDASVQEPASGATKLERFFGPDVWTTFAGKKVLDYGCGNGGEAVAAAMRGADMVYGVDVRSRMLASAVACAAVQGVADRCVFLNASTQAGEIEALRGRLDVIYSLDCFEHYPEPEAILRSARDLLAPGGTLLVSFGPPWKHAYGAHMSFFCQLPWVHLLFKEETILAVRSLYRHDGAKRFEEVDGGLNRMTVRRFDDLVRRGGFQVASLRPTPVRGWTWLVRSSLLREYFTSVVQCVLAKPS